MLIVDTISYRAQGVPSRRHSKLRSMDFTYAYSLDLVEVAEEEAPVLAEIGREQNTWVDGVRGTTLVWHPYRLAGGRVWERHGVPVAGIPEMLSRYARDSFYPYSDTQARAEEKMQRRLGEIASTFRVIAGELWRATEEPALVVREFLSYRSSTWVEITDSLDEMAKSDDRLVFRLDELELCKAIVNARIIDKFGEFDRFGHRNELDIERAMIRNLRADLLRRPSIRAFSARAAWYELATAAVTARDVTARLTALAGDLAGKLDVTAPPAGCVPARLSQLQSLLAQLSAVLEDDAISTRAATSPEQDDAQISKVA